MDSLAALIGPADPFLDPEVRREYEAWLDSIQPLIAQHEEQEIAEAELDYAVFGYHEFA